MRTIRIASDFSRYPAGRVRSDGPYSGERFRDDYLIPALQEEDGHVVLILDGAWGYGSSFLEETFGGAVRKDLDPQLLARLVIRSNENPSLIDEIRFHIDRAHDRSGPLTR